MREVLKWLPGRVGEHLADSSNAVFLSTKTFPHEQARNLAWIALAASADCMGGIEDVLERVTAPWALGRVALEAAARAAWLRDPSLSDSERLERSFALRLSDSRGSDGQAKQKAILAEASQCGIALSKEELRKVVPKSLTNMVEDSLGMGRWYGEFSQLVHHNPGAQMAIRIPTSRHPVEDTLLPAVIAAYGIAAWRFFKTSDRDHESFEPTLAKAGRVIGIEEPFWDIQPWRSG